MKANSLSIKHKLRFVSLATTGVALAVACVAFAWNDHLSARESLELRLETHARMVARAGAAALAAGDERRLRRLLETMRGDPAILRAAIETDDGRVRASFSRPDSETASAAERRVFAPTSSRLSVAESFALADGERAHITIVASGFELHERFRYYLLVAGVVIVLALVTAFALSSGLMRAIYAPIESLSNAARRIRETGDYALRAPVHFDCELGRLAADFNRMLAEIERRDRQLESDVAERTQALQQSNSELLNEVAERADTEARLRESEQRFKSAFESAAVGMVLLREDRSIFHVNQAFADMLGYTREELLDHSVRDLSHPDDRDAGLFSYHELRSGNIDNYSVEKRYVHKDGGILRCLTHTSAVRAADGTFVYSIGQIQDITEAYQLAERLSFQATHDPLTGLINRREFESRIDYALSSAQSNRREHALCYLDLDQFKVINDTCGHSAGDELLRQIAALLGGCIRTSDTLARLGGDEFGLLMEGCPLTKSQRVAETLRGAIEDFQFVWDDKRFRVGVSIGVVPINGDSSSVTEVLQQADTACYAAKDMGRNRIHVFLREDEELAKRHGEMQWVTKIQSALETDAFRLYVQPIVPVRANAAAHEHYEVLIRMHDPSGCEIPPGAFLPAAERYNLAARLDRWVLRHLLAWLTDNPAELARIDLCSVNLSGLTLADETFLDFVVDLLESSGVPSGKICFEITETAVISNLSQATRFISTLKDQGCLFALDDFGSGLSSFAYLKSLPVDFLKIDGMFVRDVFTDPIDKALVKSINDVGKVMGKQTIAEFVESEAVRGILEELGVDFAQGYGIGKPFPLENLAAPGPAVLAAVR